MITVACVLRSGGDYAWPYVRDLGMAISRNLSVPHQVICLTDRFTVPIHELDARFVRPLAVEHAWPGWWAKLEIFALEPPVLYFDLDTVIVGNIDPLANWVSDSCEGLMMLRGFYRGDRCSGIMGWRQDMRWLYDHFKNHYANRAEFMPGDRMRIGASRFRGDQNWLAMMAVKEHIPVTLAQDIFPGIYSYKVDVRDNGIPDDARIICFHGKPRPHEVTL